VLLLPHADHAEYGPLAQAIAAEPRQGQTVLSLREDQALLVRDSWMQVY
jgi:hypothetical protein